MIFDKQVLFSDAQSVVLALGASALSTNTIDTRAKGTVPLFGAEAPGDIGKGRVPRLHAQVVETVASAGAATLQVQVIQADDAALTSNVEVLSETRAHALADLVAGKTFGITLPPGVTKRYLGLRYVSAVAATTAGKITAGFVMDAQQNATV